ncbi:hypothetical protein OROMI_010381 [Orobanche minor]
MFRNASKHLSEGGCALETWQPLRVALGRGRTECINCPLCLLCMSCVVVPQASGDAYPLWSVLGPPVVLTGHAMTVLWSVFILDLVGPIVLASGWSSGWPKVFDGFAWSCYKRNMGVNLLCSRSALPVTPLGRFIQKPVLLSPGPLLTGMVKLVGSACVDAKTDGLSTLCSNDNDKYVRDGNGPILEDGPNFDMAFRLFHGHNGVVPLSGKSFTRTDKSHSESSPAQFNPLAAKAATISLSAFGPGGPFGFNAFSKKWKKANKKSDLSINESSSKGVNKSQHEATRDEWLQNGNCPIAKSYRTVSNVLHRR